MEHMCTTMDGIPAPWDPSSPRCVDNRLFMAVMSMIMFYG